MSSTIDDQILTQIALVVPEVHLVHNSVMDLQQDVRAVQSDLANAPEAISAAIDAATQGAVQTLGAVSKQVAEIRVAVEKALPTLDGGLIALSSAVTENSRLLKEIHAAQNEKASALVARERALNSKESDLIARESALASGRRTLETDRERLIAARKAFGDMGFFHRIRYPRSAKPAVGKPAPTLAPKPTRPAAQVTAKPAAEGNTGFDMAGEVGCEPLPVPPAPKVDHEAERIRSAARVRQQREHQMYVDAENGVGARKVAWWSGLLRADRVVAAIAVLIAGVAAADIVRAILQRFAG